MAVTARTVRHARDEFAEVAESCLIEETKKDPFALLPQVSKYHELLGADLFFAFITRLMIYFVTISLALPALIPILEILLVIFEEAILWALGDEPETYA